MKCTTCNQAERIPVRRAKLAERDGRVAVVTGVPMEECPACGERLLTLEVAEALDSMLRNLLDGGAASATGDWDDLTSSAA